MSKIQLRSTPIVRRDRSQASALTDIKIRQTKPRTTQFKLNDGGGLHLLVTPSGSKLWRWKYAKATGKEGLKALGRYPDVSLAEAREARNAMRKQLVQGIDPAEKARQEKHARLIAAENSFKSVAGSWWEKWKVGLSQQHAEQVMRRFEKNVFPHIGTRPITEISAPEIVAMLNAIQKRGVIDIAKRSLQTCNQVFRFAIANGLAVNNPAAAIRPGDVLQTRPAVNLARVDSKELPTLLRKIEAYRGTPLTRLAMKLIAQTFVRTSELIEAPWSEFDLDAAEWRIPAERMKAKKLHIVPLSTQSVTVLRTLHLISGHGKLLFPGERDHEKPMSNNTILKALKIMGYAGQMTGHGFRGVASTMLNDMDFKEAHIELQMAHQQRNKVAAAYNHAQYLKQRRVMMQACLRKLN
ncbi:MAG: integrase arm-type DNA-binding domain-containing protein [Polaromonas sp.]|nr:integrase arm-type DNA-binding domain-containing protein [Polaromonas sp.]